MCTATWCYLCLASTFKRGIATPSTCRFVSLSSCLSFVVRPYQGNVSQLWCQSQTPAVLPARMTEAPTVELAMHKSTSRRQRFDQKLKIFTAGVERLDRVTGPQCGHNEESGEEGGERVLNSFTQDTLTAQERKRIMHRELPSMQGKRKVYKQSNDTEHGSEQRMSIRHNSRGRDVVRSCQGR